MHVVVPASLNTSTGPQTPPAEEIGVARVSGGCLRVYMWRVGVVCVSGARLQVPGTHLVVLASVLLEEQVRS